MEVQNLTDEEKDKIISRYARMSFANLRQNILQDLVKNKNESVIYRRYSKAQVVTLLETPQKNEDAIRELSNYLYIVSSHYRRLVDYFATILLYNYIIVPSYIPKKVSKTTFKDTYMYVAKECGKYNLKHEITKGMKVAVREGVFFGLCYESEDSFYIKPVQAKYAKISGIEDGSFMYKFDLNFFKGKEELLEMYGREFVNAYVEYKGNKDKNIQGNSNKRWFEPSNGICIKVDESDPYYSLPLFTGLMLDVFSIDDYKMLQKAKTENDNYKALALELPTDKETGVPLLDYEMNEKYFNHIVDNIDNDGIGVFMSPFKVADFSFSTSQTADVDNVANAEKELFSAAGVTGGLFLSNITSSSSINLSVKPDEQLAFSMLMQFQRYFNKKLKKMDLEYEFKIEFTEQSIFNYTEYVDRYFKSSSAGLPTKNLYASSLGLTPSDMIGMAYLEEDILGLTTKCWNKPLVSSHTMTSDSSGGRPSNASQGKGLTESGEQTLEDGENDNR